MSYSDYLLKKHEIVMEALSEIKLKNELVVYDNAETLINWADSFAVKRKDVLPHFDDLISYGYSVESAKFIIKGNLGHEVKKVY